MIRLIIEPAIIDQRVDHVINWTMGWLYRNGYAFYSKEYDYKDGWDVEIYVKRLEPVNDIFGFVIDEFGDAFRHFINELDAEIEAVVVCNESEDECLDVRFSDLENLDFQEFLEIEERWQRMMYGGDDEEEEMDRKEREDLLMAECASGYRDCEDVVRFERMEGIRNDGNMGDAVFEQEDYE